MTKKSPFKFKENLMLETSDYEDVKNMLVDHESTIARINYHQNLESHFHTMLIAMKNNHAVQIHKHQDKDEFLYVLEGSLRVTFYNDQREKMGNEKILKNGNGILILKNTWHEIQAESDFCLFLENAPGPFRPDQTSYL